MENFSRIIIPIYTACKEHQIAVLVDEIVKIRKRIPHAIIGVRIFPEIHEIPDRIKLPKNTKNIEIVEIMIEVKNLFQIIMELQKLQKKIGEILEVKDDPGEQEDQGDTGYDKSQNYNFIYEKMSNGIANPTGIDVDRIRTIQNYWVYPHQNLEPEMN